VDPASRVKGLEGKRKRKAVRTDWEKMMGEKEERKKWSSSTYQWR